MSTAQNIKPHSFRHGNSTCQYMLNCVFFQEVKDGGRLKKDATLYTYVQLASLLIFQVLVENKAQEIACEFIAETGLFCNIPEVDWGCK